MILAPDDDYQEFLKQMEGVAPLGKRSRAERSSHVPAAPGLGGESQVPEPRPLQVAVPNVPPIDGNQILDWRKPGLRDGDYQKLRTGRLRPSPEEHDLHGLTLAEACESMKRTITATQRSGRTSLCLIHGKGRHSGGSRIKGVLDAILRQHPEVLGFHSVPRNTGAVNVLLRRGRT